MTLLEDEVVTPREIKISRNAARAVLLGEPPTAEIEPAQPVPPAVTDPDANPFPDMPLPSLVEKPLG